MIEEDVTLLDGVKLMTCYFNAHFFTKDFKRLEGCQTGKEIKGLISKDIQVNNKQKLFL